MLLPSGRNGPFAGKVDELQTINKDLAFQAFRGFRPKETMNRRACCSTAPAGLSCAPVRAAGLRGTPPDTDGPVGCAVPHSSLQTQSVPGWPPGLGQRAAQVGDKRAVRTVGCRHWGPPSLFPLPSTCTLEEPPTAGEEILYEVASEPQKVREIVP